MKTVRSCHTVFYHQSGKFHCHSCCRRVYTENRTVWLYLLLLESRCNSRFQFKQLIVQLKCLGKAIKDIRNHLQYRPEAVSMFTETVTHLLKTRVLCDTFIFFITFSLISSLASGGIILKLPTK